MKLANPGNSPRSCRRWPALLAACWLCVVAAPAAAAPATRPVIVYAAASLTNVLQELSARYTRAHGIAVTLSFAASSALARQIEAGATADVFLSADQQWMDYLERRALIQPASRRDLLGNRLVLVAPADSQLALTIGPHFALRTALGDDRLATGDPDTVPVGRYARAALVSLGVWDDVADRLVRADNVRTALAFVARGEVPLGIVYVSDAQADAKVRIVGVFPASSHPPITYPLALLRDAAPAAAGWVGYLRGAEARAVFQRYGFSVLP